MHAARRSLAAAIAIALALSFAGRAARRVALADDGGIPAAPRGLPEMSVPAANPLTPEKIALGEQLFFDKRLSKDGTASCETCHVHAKGWTDGEKFSKKVGGALNTRNTPSVYNAGYLTSWYWDGRAPTLEKQIEAAWKSQMGADPAAIAKAIGAIAGYQTGFEAAFGAKEPTPDAIVQALACFVRTLRSGDSAWDRYEAGEKDAVPPDAVAGFAVFRDKAHCTNCHVPPLYTDTLFHNTGIGMDKEKPDLGRGAITKDEKDNGKFKTPGLRSVTKTAPYFHDGSETTLEGAVRRMAAGGVKNANLDERLAPVALSDKEVAEILAFLKALESTEGFERPKLPE
jgi:cytochrome c peroxidase